MPSGDDTNATTAQASIAYDGVFTTVTDQASKVRRQKVDELGRVIRLDEPTSSGLGTTSSPNQATTYEYDVLGNMIHIDQDAQDRYFKYDSLSRLTYEKQVEQSAPWTTTDYVAGNNAWSRKILYNSNGLVTDAYDARQIHTTLSYDDLNRVSQISYSDSTPTAHFYYDSATGLPSGAPSSSAPDSYSPGYAAGRLVAMTYGTTNGNPDPTGNYFSYDNLGRVTTQWQLTGSTLTKYKLSYGYNLGGMLTSETYPSNHVASYAHGYAGKLSSVSQTISNAVTLANNFSFAPSGGLTSETWGNTAVHAMTYNRALQASQVKLTLGSSVLQQYDYDYGTFNPSTGAVTTSANNGQIGKITGSIGGTAQWNQGFTYDELGRLANVTEHEGASMSTQTYSQGYTYDRYGNRFQSANTTLGLLAVSSSDIDSATNRFVSSVATYDDGQAGAGNITTDSKFRGFSYAYDANHRQISASNGSWTETQVYDAGGQRVQTSVSSTTRTMVYDIFGQDVADYTGSGDGTLERENIYRGGLLATYEASSSSYKYILQDLQGSTRAVMNNNGSSSSVIARHDYLPFGEEIYSGIGLRGTSQGFATSPWANDSIRQRYAMTERDDTTGLDHTPWRKYENLSGRWTSPDPLDGSIANPQSFNRYSYTQNDPVNLVDPSGLNAAGSGTSYGGSYWVDWTAIQWYIGNVPIGVTDFHYRVSFIPGSGGGQQNPAQAQTGTGGHTQTGDCAYIRANLLGDPRNRSALNDAWKRTQAGTNSAHEEGGLLGQVIDEGQPYQKDIVINQTYTAASSSPAGALQGFTNWAQGQIASNSNTVAFGYWYHTHPFKQGTPVANNPGYVYGNPNIPSGNGYDASVSGNLGLRGIIVSRTNVVVFDSSGSILCKFKR